MSKKRPSSKANTSLTFHPEQGDLVHGDVAAIKGCLEWLEGLSNALKDCARALLPALHDNAAKLGGEARSIVLDRLRYEAAHLGAQFANATYENVVSETVTTWISPLLRDAAVACLEVIDAAETGQITNDVAGKFLARVKAPSGELRNLAQLLRSALREHAVGKSNRDGALPNWDGTCLKFSGTLLKQFKKHPAPNQRKLLEAFQTAGWPPAIQNPWHDTRLKNQSGPRRTLNETLRDLNRTIAGLIRFEALANGQCRWTPK
ncbi:MAG TPA: hypothetical protein VFE62_08990 [Gemmataceae bacterium]|nr:hypothetical protein [Gemmataceae bacterium]